jgi:transcriptional regulator with XRE-family HTH domain
MRLPREVRAFGAEVRRRRESLGWSLPELAKRSGLTYNYIGAIEMGQREPSLSTMEKIAKGFDVPVWELLGRDGLSPSALECARLLHEAPQEVRDAIQTVLEFYGKRPRR